MPTNTLITSQLVTPEILPFVNNQRVFSRNMNHQYDKYYDGSGGANAGPKNGVRIEVKLPPRFTTRVGNDMVPQGLNDDTFAIVMGEPIGIDLDINNIDWSLNLSQFRPRYGQPIGAQIANAIDERFLESALGAYFSVGTPGTTPGSASGQSAAKIWMDAKVALKNIGVPDDGNLHALMTDSAMGATVVGLGTLYNPKNTIEEQYRKGVIVDAFRLIFNSSQNIPVLTTGNRAGTITVATASVQGDTTLVVTGMSGTLNAGEIITLGGTGYPINHVNFQNRNPIPNPATGLFGTAQFVVTETVTSAGIGTNTTIKTAPAFIAPVAGVKQQGQIVDTLPVVSMQVTPFGSASSVYPQNLVYHRDAFAAAFAKLASPPGGECYNATQDGVNMRFWNDSEIRRNATLSRIDVLAACVLALRERVVRVWG